MLGGTCRDVMHITMVAPGTTLPSDNIATNIAPSVPHTHDHHPVCHSTDSSSPSPEAYSLSLPQSFPSFNYAPANAYTPHSTPYSAADATSSYGNDTPYVFAHQSPHSYQGYPIATPRYAPPFTLPPSMDGSMTPWSTAHRSAGGPRDETMQLYERRGGFAYGTLYA
ncbi:hypothetical protein C8Q78DRAFT_358911 [Trametes maxima]|nr:hypothetical protein C8Q78DRAFT_358911 [Trametes maxima]